MTGKPLEPGELRISPICVDGCHPYERVRSDGVIERGITVPPDHPHMANAAGVLEIERTDRAGVLAVKRDIRFTCKGPAQVNSAAYRNGWDGVFDRRSRGGDGCSSSRAN